MRRYAYIVQVVALLIGFYVMCAVLVVGLSALTVLAFAKVGVNKATLLLLLFTIAAIVVVVRGVFVSTRVRARHIVGVRVRPADQPALWARIHQLASQVGTRAPRRIYLVPDVNAAVWENTHLLGLVPGRRQLMIGVPLLVALTPAQLDAVLAHELGHYGNHDTRLGGLVGRTRQSVLAALRSAGRTGRFELPGAAFFVVVFRGYAKLVLRVTQAASRAQEFAADRVAAQIAGPANVIAALSQLRGISLAFGFYLDRYVSRGLEIGLLPPAPDVFAGFTALLAEPRRRAELDELRGEMETRKADPFDSHPPMAERIAALAALPGGSAAADPTEDRAVAILANPRETLAAVATRILAKEAAGKQVAPWDAVARALGQRRADEQARPLRETVARLTGRPAHLSTLVDLVDSGRYEQLLDALPRSRAAQQTNATGRVAREHAKTQLAPMLAAWIVGDLARSGQATWAHSWADIDGEVRMPAQFEADLDPAIADLIAVRPDATRLRVLLQSVSATGSAA